MSWNAMQMVAARPERHALTKRDAWAMGEDWGEPVHAGVNVSQESALRLSVVWRCIRLISETIAGLPAEAVRKRAGVPTPVDRQPGWLEFPNPEDSWFEFHERIGESLLMDGNAFILITARDNALFPAEMWTLHPSQVEVRRDTPSGTIYYVWNGTTRLSRYGPSNPGGEVLHVRLASGGGIRGMSPIKQAQQSIGLGLATEKFGARFFGRGQTMSGVISLPSTSPAFSREYIELMRETFEAAHAGTDNSHRPGIMVGGATWQGITITPEEAQFLETRKFQVEDIASRIYGVPPHMVGLQGYQSQFGTGLEQQTLGFVKFTLLPHIIRLESALSSLLPRGQFVRLDQQGLLRADSATETDVLIKQVLNGLRNRNEARARLGEPPVPGGDGFLLPANEQVLPPNGRVAPVPNGQVPAGVGGTQ